MPLKTSLLSKPLFKNLSHHILFITIVNIICTFLLIPFSYVLSSINGSPSYDVGSKYIIGHDLVLIQFYFFGTTGFAVIAGIMLTYYLKSESASDFLHSLPIKRSSIFMTTICVFLSSVIVNLLLNSLLLLLLKIYYKDIFMGHILNWIILTFLFAMFTFAFTLFIGLLVNNIVSHLVFTVMIIVTPLLLNIFITGLVDMMFAGLKPQTDDLAMKLTVPAEVINQLANNNFSIMYWFIVAIVTILLLIGSYFIYENRKNENINEGYSNKPSEYILFSWIAVLGTLLAGTAAIAIFPKNLFFMIAIFFVTFFLLYYLMEMISQKSVRITIHKRQMIISLVVTIFVISMILIVGKIRENYIPELKDIKAVSIVDFSDQNTNNEFLYANEVEDMAYINDTVQLHKELVGKESDNYDGAITIKYIMKNGSKISRHYLLTGTQKSYVNEIINRQEIVDKRFESIDWEEVKNSSLAVEKQYHNDDENGGAYLTLSMNEKARLINAFKADFMKLKSNYDQVSLAITDVTLMLDNNPYIGITPYHTETIKVLKSLGFIDTVSDLYQTSEFKIIKDKSQFDNFTNVNYEDLWNIKGKQVNDKEVKKFLDNNKAEVKGDVWYISNPNLNPGIVRISE
ncbi:hypothetical protein [Macrococcus lamae]|uniref:Uncharacterized protein n=1 Tax=Macrococcus lamae TaxID=198484 RepID=A0A4R6BVN4_9STAP|nr:hypothetical protein [Macrococcus lamae]TDM12257.1 hypothetical protein ERX29_04110 [Macrococcus lamae]